MGSDIFTLLEIVPGGAAWAYDTSAGPFFYMLYQAVEIMSEGQGVIIGVRSKLTEGCVGSGHSRGSSTSNEAEFVRGTKILDLTYQVRQQEPLLQHASSKGSRGPLCV